ncbi:PREDICTED: uncharacterized protein LOC104706117 [Camelina sativa]|uniref:Uncharacterized protein LOC104706117 n=1 Tax=Camelina sativa TaxID=90675 RepID=A0ABM0T3Z8_CAMSA|nr:PREDICTED: uncharacterized protein LOC104706117 [Camelina sativa]
MCLEGFPIFDGVAGELRPWISWLEDFFVQENFTADEKLNLAHSLLEGEADAHVQWRQSFMPFQSWEDLKDVLVLGFGKRDDPEKMRMMLENERKIQQFIKKQRDDLEADRSVEPEFVVADMIHSEEGSRQEKKAIQETFGLAVSNECVSIATSAAEKVTIHSEEAIFHKESLVQNQFNTQHQVLISDLEPSRSVLQLGFSGMDLVLANRKLGEKHFENPIFEALNGVAWIFTEESPKSQEVEVRLTNTNLSLFFDGNVAAQFQIVYGSEMDPYGYQVFDQISLRGYNLLQHKKMSKFPKSWMFKFKNSLEAQNSAPEQLLFLDIVADAKGTRDGLQGLQGLSISDIVLLQQITYKMRIETVAVAWMLYRMEQRVDSTFAKVNLSILAQLIFGETDVKHKWKSKELQAVLIIDKNSRGSDVTYGTCSAATVDKRGYFSLWHRWRDKGQNKEHGLVIVYKFQIEQQIDVWWSQIGQVIQPATFASMLLTLSITPTNPQQPVYMMIKHDSIIQRALEQI